MATLKLNNTKRIEFDESIISNLKRKGWIVVNDNLPPQIDASKEKLVYDEDTDTYQIIPLSQFEKDEAIRINTQQNLYDIINQGFLVEPENYTLSLGEVDRQLFAQMLTLIKEALDLGLISDDTPQIIKDINGQKQTVSTLRFRQIMVQYGFFYKTIWDNFI